MGIIQTGYRYILKLLTKKKRNYATGLDKRQPKTHLQQGICLNNNNNNDINDLYSANSSELLTSAFKSRSLTSVKLLKQMGLQIFLEAF